jgi:hypothetical protein
MMTQEYAAFPQKWVTGMEIPVDDNGQDIEPFDVAVNKILIAEETEPSSASSPPRTSRAT